MALMATQRQLSKCILGMELVASTLYTCGQPANLYTFDHVMDAFTIDLTGTCSIHSY